MFIDGSLRKRCDSILATVIKLFHTQKKSIAQAQRVGDHKTLPLFIRVTLLLIKPEDVVKILSFSKTNQMLGNRQTSNSVETGIYIENMEIHIFIWSCD